MLKMLKKISSNLLITVFWGCISCSTNSPNTMPSDTTDNKVVTRDIFDKELSLYSFWEGEYHDSITINDKKVPLNETIVPDIKTELGSSYKCDVEDKTIISTDENCRLTGLKEGKTKIKITSNFIKPATLTQEFEVLKDYIPIQGFYKNNNFKNKIVYEYSKSGEITEPAPGYLIENFKIIENKKSLDGSNKIFGNNILDTARCSNDCEKIIVKVNTGYYSSQGPIYFFNSELIHDLYRNPKNFEWRIKNYDGSYNVSLNYYTNLYNRKTFLNSPEWLKDNKSIILTISDAPQNIYILNTDNLKLTKLNLNNINKFDFKSKIYYSIINNILYVTKLENLNNYKINNDTKIKYADILSDASLIFLEEKNSTTKSLFSINYDGTDKKLIDENVKNFRLSGNKRYLVYSKEIKYNETSYKTQVLLKDLFTNEVKLVADGFLSDISYDGDEIVVDDYRNSNIKIINSKNGLVTSDYLYPTGSYILDLFWCK